MEKRYSIEDPKNLPKDYYEFSKYNSKSRMLTYWHQINEVLKLSPETCLEIGLGSGLVKSYLNHVGILVETMDINSELSPNYNVSVLDIHDGVLADKTYDVVLCSRVLHHISFDEFELALENLAIATRNFVVITLPVDELRVYNMFKVTSTDIYTVSIKIPLLKQIIRNFLPFKYKIGSGKWQINSSSRTSKEEVFDKVKKHFDIIKKYQIPEDSSHLLMVLRKK